MTRVLRQAAVLCFAFTTHGPFAREIGRTNAGAKNVTATKDDGPNF
jgi:hypothetical protein